MLRVLSEEEELKIRREEFLKLKPGSLFNLAGERFFIAVKKIEKKVWAVVELTESNRKKIISEQPCVHSNLHFDQMGCLNLLAG